MLFNGRTAVAILQELSTSVISGTSSVSVEYPLELESKAPILTLERWYWCFGFCVYWRRSFSILRCFQYWRALFSILAQVVFNIGTGSFQYWRASFSILVQVVFNIGVWRLT